MRSKSLGNISLNGSILLRGSFLPTSACSFRLIGEPIARSLTLINRNVITKTTHPILYPDILLAPLQARSPENLAREWRLHRDGRGEGSVPLPRQDLISEAVAPVSFHSLQQTNQWIAFRRFHVGCSFREKEAMKISAPARGAHRAPSRTKRK